MTEPMPQPPTIPQMKTQESIVSPSPKKPCCKPIIWFGIGVIITALIGGGVWFFLNMNNSQPISINPSPVASASAILDATAGWKTYTNSDYGFSFRYPQSLDSNIGGIAGPYTGTSSPVTSLSDSRTIREGTDAAFDGLNVYVVSDMKIASFDDYITQEQTAMIQSVNAFMQGAEKIKFSNGQALVTNSRGYYYLPFPDNKKVLVIVYIQANDSFKTIFNQILSTFKFTE
jgi:hypothetical protein